jgi:hypothetical protein
MCDKEECIWGKQIQRVCIFFKKPIRKQIKNKELEICQECGVPKSKCVCFMAYKEFREPLIPGIELFDINNFEQIA